MRKLFISVMSLVVNKKNADKVATLVRELSDLYPTICFISPIHAFGFLYESTDYDRGMSILFNSFRYV